ncbi:hypothetical protein [Ferruginivarius sediminum]|uniref:NUDIX hydrolase n=1 Tax=Ferruginivarius sediminum TaxID=2661937 RepID=A0A369TIP0_9PROT|nr:hypothetical protein DRB17_06195 [Ferruginivarius sediminum]
MPGVFVPPGGRLDHADLRPSGYTETMPAQPPGIDRATSLKLKAFARCALRETFEETGLLIGEGMTEDVRFRMPRSATTTPWRSYLRAGRHPAFDRMYLLARAITPTASPIRFHTRFFLCNGDAATQVGTGDGEIEAVDWIAWREWEALPMAEVTQLVLTLARDLRIALAQGGTRPVERLLWRGDRRVSCKPLGRA